jgi:phosphatidylglycerophosphate synthase
MSLVLAPALLATAFFVLGLLAFSVRCAIYGVPKDRETESRGASALVGYFLRHYFFWLVQPVIRWLLRSGIRADQLTMISAALGATSGVAIAFGRFALGGWLFLLSGILDALDGRIARLRNDSSKAGAAMDSILDRYTDSFVLIGLAWYYRDSWVLALALFAFLGSSLVPYIRARGEGLGIELKVGVMQRVERVLTLGACVALGPLLEPLFVPSDQLDQHWLAIGGLFILSVSSNATAITRFVALMRVLRRNPPTRK